MVGFQQKLQALCLEQISVEISLGPNNEVPTLPKLYLYYARKPGIKLLYIFVVNKMRDFSPTLPSCNPSQLVFQIHMYVVCRLIKMLKKNEISQHGFLKLLTNIDLLAEIRPYIQFVKDLTNNNLENVIFRKFI